MTQLAWFLIGMVAGLVCCMALIDWALKKKNRVAREQRHEIYTALGYRFYNQRYAIKLLDPKFDDFIKREEWCARVGADIMTHRMNRESQCQPWTS